VTVIPRYKGAAIEHY